jgi:hypothetical protein
MIGCIAKFNPLFYSVFFSYQDEPNFPIFRASGRHVEAFGVIVIAFMNTILWNSVETHRTAGSPKHNVA